MGHSLRGVYGSLQTWVAWGKLSSCMPSLKVTQLAAGESQFVNWLCVFFFLKLGPALSPSSQRYHPVSQLLSLSCTGSYADLLTPLPQPWISGSDHEASSDLTLLSLSSLPHLCT